VGVVVHVVEDDHGASGLVVETWNVLCAFLYTSEFIAANPMPLVGRPNLAKTLPKSLPTATVIALLAALDADPEPRRRSDWVERDHALILTALLAGLRADELLRPNVSDVHRTDGGAVIQIRGKFNKDRRVPVETALVDVLEGYLDSRAARFPEMTRRRSSPAGGLAAWPPTAPLSSAPMVNASPVAPCSTGCCVPSHALGSTPIAPAAHLCMGCDTPSPRN
jgi:integrase